MIDSNSIINFIISKFKTISYASLSPQIRELLITSINRNFQVGGRYGKDNPFGGGSTKWKKSKRAVLQSGMTLQDTGQMAASLRVQVKFEGNKLIIQMGSNKKYAAHQHFGSKEGGFQHPGGTPYIIKNGKAVFVKKSWASQNEKKIRGYTKPHKISIPARPFLVIQDEDIKNIRDMIARKIISRF